MEIATMIEKYANLINAKYVNPKRLLESGKFDCEDDLNFMDWGESTWFPVDGVEVDCDGFVNVSCGVLSPEYAITLWDYDSVLLAFR